MSDNLWERDSIQFPRLIAELEVIGAFTPGTVAALCREMDLTPEEISQLLNRAQVAWEPTFRESNGQVMLDDFQVVAKFDLRLPSVDPNIDGHRFAAGAYRLTQSFDLAWGRVGPFGESGAYARPQSRSTALGDLIFVHIDGADLRAFEVTRQGYLPVKVFIGAGKQKRRKAA